jgi:carbon-monoxide dehydrogenase iron sulfur subunit
MSTSVARVTSVIVCRVDRCLSCRSCELACALAHSRSADLIGALQDVPVPLTRVRVLSLGREGVLTRHRTIALQCRHCAEPLCVEVCIAGGVTKDEAAGLVHFNEERCVGCWSCTMVCPFGAVVRARDRLLALHCDLCGEREILACVEACPTRALVLCDPEGAEGSTACDT